MIDWDSKIDTIKSESFFPKILVACGETVNSPKYYWDNSHRPDKPHLFFKYTLAGRGMIEVNEQQYSVGPGQGFIMRVPDENTKYYYPPDALQPWRFVYFCFNGGRSEKLYDEITAKYGNLFTLDLESEIVQDMMRLRYLEDKTISAAAGANLVFRLFTSLVRSRTEVAVNVSGNLLINKAKQYITANLGGQINVFDTACALGVSREHLTRIFHAYLGITPHDYIEKERIYAACILLRNGSLSIKQVSDKCGFCSPSQFGRVFKRLTKETPGNYRFKTIVPGIHNFS